MFSDGIRLNVGQVETLTLWEEEIRFFFRSPLNLNPEHGFKIHLTDSPVFPSVPVPSGICIVPIANIRSVPRQIREAHEAFIHAAASFKRVSPFKKSFSPAILEHIEWVLDTRLPRPRYIIVEPQGSPIVPLADELDASQSFVEGAKYQVTVNAYERDPRARQLCIKKHGTTCVICGFSFGNHYGIVAEGFIHVHHVRPLSEVGDEYIVDPIEDLRPVCPNCHAVLHRRIPAFSIDEVQGFLEVQRRATFGTIVDK